MDRIIWGGEYKTVFSVLGPKLYRYCNEICVITFLHVSSVFVPSVVVLRNQEECACQCVSLACRVGEYGGCL